METRANFVWVGAVTLALLALVAAAIVWIARLNEGNQNDYDIFFSQSVDGLSNGSSVSFSGVPVGQVSLIELWKKDPSFVRVRIKVDQGTPILVGTTATIQASFTGVSNIQLGGAMRDSPRLACPKDNPRATCPEGVPVIPTKRGGFGELLNSAPVLLERLATVTERIGLLLSDKNLKSVENTLANTDRISAGLATASPQVERALIDLQEAIRQAKSGFAAYEQVAVSADNWINGEGPSIAKELRETLNSAQRAADALQKTVDATAPAAKQFSESTLPQTEAAIRDLRSATRALRNVTEKVDDQGAGSLLGSPPLPDYKP
jgi:phospholipid/cholesterol/gamma-HCH transport system substrate-binding protein